MTLNPYMPLNFNTAFTCGAILGNSLRESLLGANYASGSVNFNVFDNTCFPMPAIPAFTSNMSIFPQSWCTMPFIQPKQFGFSFNNIDMNFNVGYSDFGNWFVRPFNFNFDITNINSSQRINNTNYATLEDYNESKGRKIADIAYENTSKRFDTNWKCIGSKNREAVIDHDCARHVALAIHQAGLGDARVNSAYKMPDKLRRNPNFKELPVEGTDWNNLPPGAVCIYNPGKHGYSKKHGHVTIITENGNAAEHFSTNLLEPDYIFIPI